MLVRLIFDTWKRSVIHYVIAFCIYSVIGYFIFKAATEWNTDYIDMFFFFTFIFLPESVIGDLRAFKVLRSLPISVSMLAVYRFAHCLVGPLTWLLFGIGYHCIAPETLSLFFVFISTCLLSCIAPIIYSMFSCYRETIIYAMSQSRAMIKIAVFLVMFSLLMSMVMVSAVYLRNVFLSSQTISSFGWLKFSLLCIGSLICLPVAFTYYRKSLQTYSPVSTKLASSCGNPNVNEEMSSCNTLERDEGVILGVFGGMLFIIFEEILLAISAYCIHFLYLASIYMISLSTSLLIGYLNSLRTYRSLPITIQYPIYRSLKLPLIFTGIFIVGCIPWLFISTDIAIDAILIAIISFCMMLASAPFNFSHRRLYSVSIVTGTIAITYLISRFEPHIAFLQLYEENGLVAAILLVLVSLGFLVSIAIWGVYSLKQTCLKSSAPYKNQLPDNL